MVPSVFWFFRNFLSTPGKDRSGRSIASPFTCNPFSQRVYNGSFSGLTMTYDSTRKESVIRMHDRSTGTFQPSHKPGLLCLLLVALLTSLTASCAHQPWDINRYILALERPQQAQYQQPEKVIEALNLTHSWHDGH